MPYLLRLAFNYEKEEEMREVLGIKDTLVFEALKQDCIRHGDCWYSVVDTSEEFSIRRHRPQPPVFYRWVSVVYYG